MQWKKKHFPQAVKYHRETKVKLTVLGNDGINIKRKKKDKM